MAEKIDREKWIEQFMAATGWPRDRVETAADLEFGVSQGDAEIIEGELDDED